MRPGKKVDTKGIPCSKRIMLRVTFVFVAVCSALLLLDGCTQKSSARGAGFESAVVDGKKRPLSGIRVTATQVGPVTGHEKIETSTNSLGRFRLEGLYPKAEYEIAFSSDTWETGRIVLITAPGDGMVEFVSRIMVRFMLVEKEIIHDSVTGLQWARDPGETVTWQEAGDYVRYLRAGGKSDWRLPTRKELYDLYDFSERRPEAYKINGLFSLGGCNVWSSEVSEEPLVLPPEEFDKYSAKKDKFFQAWLFSFCSGQYYTKLENKDGSTYQMRSERVLPVRSPD